MTAIVPEHSHTTRFEQTISGLGSRIYCTYCPGNHEQVSNFAWIHHLISLGVQKMWNAFAQSCSSWCWSRSCMWHVPCHGDMNEERAHSVSQTVKTETRDMREYTETSVLPEFQRQFRPQTLSQGSVVQHQSHPRVKLYTIKSPKEGLLLFSSFHVGTSTGHVCPDGMSSAVSRMCSSVSTMG